MPDIKQRRRDRMIFLAGAAMCKNRNEVNLDGLELDHPFDRLFGAIKKGEVVVVSDWCKKFLGVEISKEHSPVSGCCEAVRLDAVRLSLRERLHRLSLSDSKEEMVRQANEITAILEGMK